MKTKLLVLMLCLAPLARAENLTAVPFKDVVARMESTEFAYAGRGLAFGFSSIQSCAWASADFLVLQHYCHPKRDYPARSFELWSKEFGIVQVYEEILADGVVKRDIRINEFPENAAPAFPDDFRVLDMEGISLIGEKLYHRWNPACWSTNFDQNARAPEVACYQTEISRFPGWAIETQGIVNDVRAWDLLWQRLNRKIPAAGGT